MELIYTYLAIRHKYYKYIANMICKELINIKEEYLKSDKPLSELKIPYTKDEIYKYRKNFSFCDKNKLFPGGFIETHNFTKYYDAGIEYLSKKEFDAIMTNIKKHKIIIYNYNNPNSFVLQKLSIQFKIKVLSYKKLLSNKIKKASRKLYREEKYLLLIRNDINIWKYVKKHKKIFRKLLAYLYQHGYLYEYFFVR